MAKGILITDLEDLEAEYNYKINTMSMKLRNGEYKHKVLSKITETLASYMSSLDELKFLRDVFYKLRQQEQIPNTFREHLDFIQSHCGGKRNY